MSLDRAREHLRRFGLDERVLVFDRSSATVPEAAAAVGTAPERIAKSLSFLVGDCPVLVVAAGDARVDNAAFKRQFGVKARMIPADSVLDRVGYAVGGVCPFGVEPDVEVHLDESLRRFPTVFPACGSANSAVELSIEQLELVSGHAGWVAVTTYG